ncbi:MAG: YebG family protein [Desulfobacteraceae bacterium]|nr:YebG family protein [Desulfobacteraceae bacterium]
MPGISKKEADAYDKMMDAASELADLIESGDIHFEVDKLEELSIFLASNACAIKKILGTLKHSWP